MKLSKLSWHYWIYTLYADNNLNPKNFCDYFWTVVLTLIVTVIGFPVTICWILAKIFKNNHGFYLPKRKDIFFVIFIYFSFFMLGSVCIGKPHIGWLSFVFFYISIAFCILVVFIGYLIEKLRDYIQEKKHMGTFTHPYPKKKRIKIIKEYIKSVKEKNCPIIEWSDKKIDEENGGDAYGDFHQ